MPVWPRWGWPCPAGAVALGWAAGIRAVPVLGRRMIRGGCWAAQAGGAAGYPPLCRGPPPLRRGAHRAKKGFPRRIFFRPIPADFPPKACAGFAFAGAFTEAYPAGVFVWAAFRSEIRRFGCAGNFTLFASNFPLFSKVTLPFAETQIFGVCGRGGCGLAPGRNTFNTWRNTELATEWGERDAGWNH